MGDEFGKVLTDVQLHGVLGVAHGAASAFDPHSPPGRRPLLSQSQRLLELASLSGGTIAAALGLGQRLLRRSACLTRCARLGLQFVDAGGGVRCSMSLVIVSDAVIVAPMHEPLRTSSLVRRSALASRVDADATRDVRVKALAVECRMRAYQSGVLPRYRPLLSVPRSEDPPKDAARALWRHPQGRNGRMARLSPAARLALVAVGWLGFVCATEHWMLWGEPIRRNYATDELQYQSIAAAAPGLPGKPVSAAAGQRVATNWIVGSLADLTGTGLHTAFRVAAVLCVFALTAVLIRLCLAFALPEWAAVIALGLVLTNPYTLRLLLIAPAMLSDVVLVLGTAIALLGLIEERWPLAVAGCVVAVLGREMGLAVAAGTCVWLLVRRRPAAALLALVIPGSAFAIAKAVGDSFSSANPSVGGFTIVSPLLHLPGTARLLADHFGRVAIAAPVALAVLSTSLVVLAKQGRLGRADSPLAAALLFAALLLVQPLLFNPEWVQHNESRLASLGIVPLAFAAVAALVRTDFRPSRAADAAIVAGIAVASLHHRYTWSGLLIPGYVFVSVEALVAGALAVLVLASTRDEPSSARAASETR